MKEYRICGQCGHTYTSEDAVFVREAIYDKERDDWSACPCCRSTEFMAGGKCFICGEICDESNMLTLNICHKCANEIKSKFEIILRENFTENEIAAINEIYDGNVIGE